MRVSAPVPATPIIRWLHEVAGPTDEFNQTVLVQAPVGVTEADVVVVLQAVLDRHATLAVAGRRRRCGRLVAAGARSRVGGCPFVSAHRRRVDR